MKLPSSLHQVNAILILNQVRIFVREDNYELILSTHADLKFIVGYNPVTTVVKIIYYDHVALIYPINDKDGSTSENLSCDSLHE